MHVTDMQIDVHVILARPSRAKLHTSAFARLHHFTHIEQIARYTIYTVFNMAWRNQGITGSNNIPLGSRRRFGGEDDDGGSVTPSTDLVPESGLKRGRSPVRGGSHYSIFRESTTDLPNAELNPDGTKKRKKRNRWGEATENKAAGLMNLPTAVMGNMTSEQLDAYTLHLRIEEISQKLRINDVVPADGDR